MKLLDTQRQFLKNFQQDYNTLVSKYLRDIGDTDIAILYNTIDDMEENLRNFWLAVLIHGPVGDATIYKWIK